MTVTAFDRCEPGAPLIASSLGCFFFSARPWGRSCPFKATREPELAYLYAIREF